MYSACLFCNASLGANERIESLPIGGRLAFDASRGRLWIVCGRCSRWNLAPIDERHEAIEQCERLYRATRTRVSTDNVGLARLADGLELIRIGAPLRPEFAAWRYGSELFNRRHRAYVAAGVGVAAAGAASVGLGVMVGPMSIAAGAASILYVPGLTTMMATIPALGVAIAKDYLQLDRVVARFVTDNGMIQVRAKHLESISLHFDDGDPAIDLQHDDGRVHFRGTRATHAATVILANANRRGASSAVIRDAVRQIEILGTAEGYLGEASRRNGWRDRTVSILNRYRGLGAMNLTGVERLALEMSVHEETERRAMSGELALLARAWRDAEEIARICDDELTPLVPRLVS